MDRPTLAGILRTHGSTYRRSHALSPTQARAWRAIVDCRTAALGGVRERCANCGAERHVWRSCRNRHCPQCQTRAKEAWRAARLREVLPVPYAHWVFTLPHALNPLAIRHPRWLYGALFDSAAATLLELAANPRWLGAVPGFSLVLHTWSQDLRMHLHVHALITCGGLDAEGRWRTPVRGTRFLFPVQAASKVFRGKFLARLDAAHRSGELPDDPHAAPGAWQARRRALLAHDWVVYAKPPPGGPAQVLDYLARYTHRVALSNDRLLGCEGPGAPSGARQRNRRQTYGEPADRHLHRTLPAPRAAGRLQAPAPLRAARLRPQAGPACRRPCGTPDAGTTSGGDRSGRGLPRPRQRGGPAMLPALWGRALAHGRDRHGSPVRSARAGAALSGWAAMNTHAPPSQSSLMRRSHRQAVARSRTGERDRHHPPDAGSAPRLRPITAMAASAEPGAATR
jgi:hypothetical protein